MGEERSHAVVTFMQVPSASLSRVLEDYRCNAEWRDVDDNPVHQRFCKAEGREKESSDGSQDGGSLERRYFGTLRNRSITGSSPLYITTSTASGPKLLYRS